MVYTERQALTHALAKQPCMILFLKDFMEHPGSTARESAERLGVEYDDRDRHARLHLNRPAFRPYVSIAKVPRRCPYCGKAMKPVNGYTIIPEREEELRRVIAYVED